jgi:hypothetical protein
MAPISTPTKRCGATSERCGSSPVSAWKSGRQAGRGVEQGGAIGPVLVRGEVFFADVAGVRWHRDFEHRLSEVRGPRDEIPEETPEPSGPVVPGDLLRPGELVVPVREGEEASPQHESRDDP